MVRQINKSNLLERNFIISTSFVLAKNMYTMSMNSNNTNEKKDGRLREAIHHLAAEFLNLESNGASLITVTNCEVLDKGRRVNIFFTVLPVEKEAVALEFAQRKRGDFSEYVKNKVRIGNMPHFEFMIDIGEKNRQKIDSFSHEDKDFDFSKVI